MHVLRGETARLPRFATCSPRFVPRLRRRRDSASQFFAAARAALASRAQKDGSLYPDFHDALITHRGAHNEASVMATAEKLGLDIDALKAEMNSDTVRDQINSTYALARTLSINGTPAFIIGDEVVRGYIPAERLAAFAKAEREDS